MTIHIDYDREENKIESILASQTKMIRTLAPLHLMNSDKKRAGNSKKFSYK